MSLSASLGRRGIVEVAEGVEGLQEVKDIRRPASGRRGPTWLFDVRLGVGRSSIVTRSLRLLLPPSSP